MRRVRSLVVAVAMAAVPVVVTASPADALLCHDGQSCDCSVRVRDKVIIPCNQ